jgi:ribose-phosphate pyrophosphokinase
MALLGDVKGRNVVLVDDIIDTGTTICKAAKLIMDKGATSIRAFCTHPVLSGKAYELLEKSDFAEIVVSDTIPLKKSMDKITVLTTAGLLADVIRRVHKHKSISSLYQFNKNNH